MNQKIFVLRNKVDILQNKIIQSHKEKDSASVRVHSYALTRVSSEIDFSEAIIHWTSVTWNGFTVYPK